MFQTKTFNLVHEKEHKKYEMLYDLKRYCWASFIFITVLLGFALLLVLVKVDFSGDSDASSNTKTTKDYAHKELRLQYEQPELKFLDDGCSTVGGDNCNIYCFGNWLESLPKELAIMQTHCQGNLKVVLNGCAMSGNTLKATHLAGNFFVEYLEFDSVVNANIQEIEDGAFNSPSMAALETLIYENSAVKFLNESTFHGLSQLQVFNMTLRDTAFKGTGFLQPFAATLLRLMLRHIQSTKVFDPTDWLQGAAYFIHLWQIDLSNNNFNDKLRPETFAKMTAVKEIYLMKSKISHIAEGTFVAVAKTLKLLDLSNNHLITLDLKFLPGINGTLTLELQGNKWNCSCDNYELINAFKSTKITYKVEPKCTSPPNFKDMPLSYVVLDCIDENPKDNTPPTPKPPLTTSSVRPTDITTTIDPMTTTDPTTTSNPATTTDPTTTSDPATTTDPTTTSDPTTTPDPTTTNDPLITTDATTPDPVQYINLYCSRYSAHSSAEKDNNITLRNYDAYFSIVESPQTPNSVILVVESDMTDLNLIYFIPNNTTYINATNSTPALSLASQNYRPRQLETFARAEVTVEGLSTAQLYLFCLIPKNETKISPFNCLPYYMQVAHARKSAWLSKGDVAWVITVFVIGLILALCCGTLAVYFLLRWRPTWLRGSKRMIRSESKSQEVYLLPNKPKQTELPETDDTYGKSYDYLQFYKDLPNVKEIRKPQESAHMSPYEPAPTIPTGSRSQTSSSRTKAPVEDTIEDDDYQSINYYEPMP